MAVEATGKQYGGRGTFRGRIARRVAAVGAAAVLAGVVAGPAHAVSQPVVTAGERQPVPGILAARSTHVTLVNLTDRYWTFGEASLRSGTWSSSLPRWIGPYSEGRWQSESNGAMTGTEGRAVYATEHGPVEVHWSNPFVGSNTYSCRVPSGYSCERTGGSGNNASVTFEVRPA